MKKDLRLSALRTVVCAALGVSVALALVSCKKGGAESNSAAETAATAASSDIDYYTCTMHPSVRSKVPGKCPICGMDLVPVKKKSALASQANAKNTNNPPGMSEMSGTETGTNLETEQPSEFIVPTERQQQIGVTFGQVEKRPFQQTIRAFGVVAPDKQRQWDYVTRVDGYIQKLDVFSPGEMVDKGAPLLTIYSPALYTAQKEFVDALAMQDRARAHGSDDVLSSAEQLVKAGRERLRLWEINEDQIAALEKTRKAQETLALFSPFKGVVQELSVDQGRRIAAGDKVVKVADLSLVWVWAQFYQTDLAALKTGLPVTISTSAYPDEKFNGKIVVIDPFLNDALRTARVRIDVDNPDFKLRPEMYVDAELSLDMGEGLAVPVGAILPTGLHNIAFVDKGGGKLEPRFVELAGEFGDFYEVKSGLKEGERVVTSANFLIDAEAKVQGALKDW